MEEQIGKILNDRSHVNKVIDIITMMDNTESVTITLKCIDALGIIFTNFIASGDCPMVSTSIDVWSKKKLKTACDDPLNIFRSWLHTVYKKSVKKIIKMLHSNHKEVRERSLLTLMNLLQCEGKTASQCRPQLFPRNLLLKIIQALVSGSMDMEHVIKAFKPHFLYADVCYYSLQNIAQIISSVSKPEQGVMQTFFLNNVFNFLRLITIPPNTEQEFVFLCSTSHQRVECNSTSDLEHNHNVNILSYKKIFSDSWLSFLNLNLDGEIHRKVLVILHEKVIPYLQDPKVLMDFLTDSYNVGGITSVLSLNSLFILIHQYNMDYPDFYKKLYSLFNVEIFYMKYRGRFFHLADLCLMSTHLPAYLVAAFIKRLSRISLRAPPFAIEFILMFIGNLLMRHPNCKILIHRKKEKTDVGASLPEDPYLEFEADPDKCKALESSLWEIETLRQHYYPGINNLVQLFEKTSKKTEENPSEYYDTTYKSVFDVACVELTKSNSLVEYRIPEKFPSKILHGFWVDK